MRWRWVSASAESSDRYASVFSWAVVLVVLMVAALADLSDERWVLLYVLWDVLSVVAWVVS